MLVSDGPITKLVSDGPITKLVSDGPITKLVSDGLMTKLVSVAWDQLWANRIEKQGFFLFSALSNFLDYP